MPNPTPLPGPGLRTAPSPPPLLAERRASPRRPAPLILDAVLLDAPGQPEIKVTGTDTSQHGMAFECARVFRAGERVAVKFRLNNDVIKLLFCRTRYCRRTEAGLFHVGVEFVDATLPVGIGPAR